MRQRAQVRAMATVSDGSFHLGDWLVEPSLNRLSRGETNVQVRPRLMDVLAFLARHAGDVMPKEEIIASVWAKGFLAESVLTRTVAELRQVLGDDAGEPRFIQTIPKRGYRIVAPVEWTAGAPEIGRPGGSRAPRPRPAPVSGCCLVWGEREIALVEGENLIGRSGDAALPISSSKVSRHHARIAVAGGRATLENLDSKNGTFLWGRRVQAVVELADGDEICVGRDVMIFRFCYPAGTTVTDEAL